jgi:hypothetical protein
MLFGAALKAIRAPTLSSYTQPTPLMYTQSGCSEIRKGFNIRKSVVILEGINTAG